MFVLADVCKVLDLNNVSQVKARLEEGVISNRWFPNIDRAKTLTVIDEDGLYDVILDSRKPQAKRFRKWVTSEVLPSIRKSGSYEVPQGVPLAELFQATAQLLVKQTETEVAITI